MTPTERAAVAAAIAALEPFAETADWAERNGHDLLNGGFDMLLRGPNHQMAGHLHAQRDDFIRAKSALASLRAVAPAPADQSDAGRDGVIEECAKIAERQEEIERELRMAANKPTADADAAAYHLWAEQSAAIVKRQIRALASAPSETVGPRGWRPIETAPRDGTDIIVATKGDAPCDRMVSIGRWLDNSETHWPWRGWHTKSSPWPEHWVDRWMPIPTHPDNAPLALPTADRDTIREALKLAKDVIRAEAPWMAAAEVHAKITDALALIGEG